MNKTTPSDVSVQDFIAQLDNPRQQKDSEVLMAIMQSVSGEKPVMWGSSIVGFGTMHYTYSTGREGDWMKIGFSPRKGKISLYITGDAAKYSTELASLGKHKIGKGCIYIHKLSDIDTNKLSEIIEKAYNTETYF